MLNLKDYDKTLEFIANLRPETSDFRKTVLQQLQKMYGYTHTTFFVVDSTGNLNDPIASNISNYFNEIYVQYYHKVDMFNLCNISSSLLRKKVVSVTDIMSYDQFVNTEYYSDFIKKINLHYEVILPLRTDDELLGMIGVFKSKEEGEFTSRDSMILNKINDHIAYNLKTFQYINKIQTDQQLYKCCSQQSPLGILVLNQDFSLLYYNEQASLYCRDITVSQSVQGAISQVLNIIIEKIINRAFDTAVTLHSYKIRIIPQIIPGPGGSFDTIYITYLTGVDQLNAQVIERLAGIYSLSNREQEILKLIYNGFSNQEIAQKYYISIHTVKSHIESIFRKMGINKRTSLFNIINEVWATL